MCKTKSVWNNLLHNTILLAFKNAGNLSYDWIGTFQTNNWENTQLTLSFLWYNHTIFRQKNNNIVDFGPVGIWQCLLLLLIWFKFEMIWYDMIEKKIFIYSSG